MAAVKKGAVHILSQCFIQLIKVKKLKLLFFVRLWKIFFFSSPQTMGNDQVLFGVFVPSILGGEASRRWGGKIKYYKNSQAEIIFPAIHANGKTFWLPGLSLWFLYVFSRIRNLVSRLNILSCSLTLVLGHLRNKNALQSQKCSEELMLNCRTAIHRFLFHFQNGWATSTYYLL